MWGTMGEHEDKSYRVPFFKVPIIKGSHVKILTKTIELQWKKEKVTSFEEDWVKDLKYM